MIYLFLVYFINIDFDEKRIDLRNDVYPFPSVPKKQLMNLQPFNYSEYDRLPLRVYLELQTNSSHYCSKSGDIVTIPLYNYQVYCSQSHVLTPEKFENVQIILKYISDIFLNYFKINRNPNPIMHGNLTLNYDLYVPFFIVPFPSELGTTAGFATVSEYFEDFRPKKGIIVMPPSNIPEKIDKNNIRKEEFFLILFHEMIHCLGFSGRWFKNFLNRETGLPWGDSLPYTTYINPRFPNKTFKILHTPMAKKYAVKRFGIKEFAPGVPMGIEIESDGGSGTEGSHPEMRVYMSELMGGDASYQPLYISDLVLCLIEDMGWYSVDFSLAEHLPWGNGLSLGQGPLTNFPNKPPLTHFPRHYLITDMERSYGCSYDYFSVGRPFIESFQCPQETAYCKSMGFYNSEFFEFKGMISIADYVPYYIGFPSTSCYLPDNEKNFDYSSESKMKFDSGSYCWNFETNSLKLAGCYKSVCSSKNDFVELYYGNQVYRCNNEGDIIFVNDSFVKSFICPSPKIFCNTIKLKEKKIENFERVSFPIDAKNALLIWIIIIIIILLIIVVGFYLFYIKFIKLKEETTTSDFKSFY